MSTTESIESLRTLSGGMPLFGHMVEAARDRRSVLDRITVEVDRISRMRCVANLPVVIVNHPETIQELLVERARAFLIEASGLPGIHVAGEAITGVPAASSRMVPVKLHAPAAAAGSHPIEFHVRALGPGGAEVSEDSVFVVR